MLDATTATWEGAQNTSLQVDQKFFSLNSQKL